MPDLGRERARGAVQTPHRRERARDDCRLTPGVGLGLQVNRGEQVPSRMWKCDSSGRPYPPTPPPPNPPPPTGDPACLLGTCSHTAFSRAPRPVRPSWGLCGSDSGTGGSAGSGQEDVISRCLRRCVDPGLPCLPHRLRSSVSSPVSGGRCFLFEEAGEMRWARHAPSGGPSRRPPASHLSPLRIPRVLSCLRGPAGGTASGPRPVLPPRGLSTEQMGRATRRRGPGHGLWVPPGPPPLFPASHQELPRGEIELFSAP